jgi:hypothetical protein
MRKISLRSIGTGSIPITKIHHPSIAPSRNLSTKNPRTTPLKTASTSERLFAQVCGPVSGSADNHNRYHILYRHGAVLSMVLAGSLDHTGPYANFYANTTF